MKILSFGENCLANDILTRYHLETELTPFSLSKSNVEYILQLERDHYKDFLNPENLAYEYFRDEKVVRLKKYNKIENQYHILCMNGFEFTHHDIISNPIAREAMQKSCEGLKQLKNETLFILYHHRFCPNTNMDMLIRHLGQLKEIYQQRGNKVNLIMFTQKIISDPKDRKMLFQNINGIYVYTFYTLTEWGGRNHDIFYARCDDDLIEKMIESIKLLF